MKRTKRRLKKWVRLVLLLLLLIIIGLVIFMNLDMFNRVSNLKDKKKTVEVEKVVLKEYVVTEDVVDLYGNDNKILGKVGKGVILHLGNEKDGYHKLYDMDGDYYVNGKNLLNYEEKVKVNDRYKKYIVFNKNIKTSKVTSFYDEEDNLVYVINKDMNLPIVVMDDKKVGVVYNNRILFVKIDDSANVIDSDNTKDSNIGGIGVLNYHFFYDDSKPEEVSDCNQDVCMSFSNLKKQLDYIRDNDYFTPTMKEFEMYIDGKLQLPKSIVITIDDGWRAIGGIDIINEYKLNATMFLVTSWYDAKDFKREYVEVHSHSDNMHNVGVCSNGRQGGGIQCLPENDIFADLKKSSEKLGGSKVFCYPFYEYNDYSISMLKKAGYTMAFAGEKSGSNNMTTTTTNKYAIPRFVMVNYTTMKDFAKYLEGKFYS